MKCLALVASLVPVAATAEIIEFESDSEVRLIRCIDHYSGAASCEVITGEAMLYTCIALDLDGNPIASANLLGNMASVEFPEIAPEDIADVKCRS